MAFDAQSVTKLRKPSVGLSANHHPMCLVGWHHQSLLGCRSRRCHGINYTHCPTFGGESLTQARCATIAALIATSYSGDVCGTGSLREISDAHGRIPIKRISTVRS